MQKVQHHEILVVVLPVNPSVNTGEIAFVAAAEQVAAPLYERADYCSETGVTVAIGSNSRAYQAKPTNVVMRSVLSAH